MGKQNKKKPVSSKKKSKSSSKKVTVELDDVIRKADASLEASDLDTALQLYNYAAQQLRTQPRSNHEHTDDSVDNRVVSQRVFTFAKVLGKMAECKVSMAQHDSAQADFLEALQSLESISKNWDSGKKESETGNIIEDNVEMQYVEIKAGIQLYLAQLCQGEDALEYFHMGIQSLITFCSLLEAMKNNTQLIQDSDEPMIHPTNDSTEEEHLPEKTEQALLEARRQVCKAYCSIADLFLTDLCFEPDAELKCEEAIRLALTYDDPHASPDALQALANLQLSQSDDKRSEAYTYMLQAYERMRLGCEALAQLVGLGSKDDEDITMDNTNENLHHALELKDEMLQAANTLPPFEFRCQSVKLLLECAAILEKQSDSQLMTDTCVEASIQILGSLLAENDEVPEIFYLLGTAFMCGSCPNLESARFYLDRALEMTEKIKQEMEKDAVKGMNDEQWEDDHDDLISRIGDIHHKISEIQVLEERN